MAFCAFGDQYALFDSTPVENMFVQEYMLRAPGNYVKVYLYGLMLCYHPAEGMSLLRMAHDMGMDEDEVFQAFQYWERQGLVRRVADNPPQYAYKNLKHTLLQAGGQSEDLYQYKEFNQRLHAIFEKKRKLYEQDYRRIYEWMEALHLPEDVVIQLIIHSIDQWGMRFSFEKAEALAREWAERGVDTAEEAEAAARSGKQLTADVRKVLTRLGQRRAPSMDELELYNTWTQQWSFTLPAILEACRETTKGAPTMAYLNGILERQHQLGRHDAGGIAGGLSAERAAAEPVRAIYQALGRRGVAPTEADLALVGEWLRQGADGKLLALAAQVAHHNGGNSLEAVGQRLEAWRAKGLGSAAQVETYLAQVKRDNALLQEIYDACGATQRLSAADRAMLSVWRDQWRMPREVMLLAAEAAAHAAVKMPFIDKVLGTWNNQAIRTVEAARAERANHQEQARPEAAGASASAPRRPAKEVAQHRYGQRTYEAEELEALDFDIIAEAEKRKRQKDET